MVELNDLARELLLAIGVLIHDSSRNTIFSLLTVNKNFHDTFLLLAYRQYNFDFTEYVPNLRKGFLTPFAATQLKLRGFLERDADDFIFHAVRKVVIRSAYSNQDDSKWTPLAEFISRLSNLEEITYDCRESLPLALLTVLHEHHVSAHLHVRNWTRKSCDVKVGDPQEEALARSTCLRSIEAKFISGGGDGISETNEAALMRIIALAPNIHSASFTSRSEGGCVMTSYSEEEIEEEARECARFDVEMEKPKVLKKLGRDCMNASTFTRVERYVDLSKIESLEAGMVYHDGLLRAINHTPFHSLRHLSLVLPELNAWATADLTAQESRAAVTAFLSSLPPLQSLSVTNYAKDLDLSVVLLHHGESLLSLSLHESEDPENARPVYSPANLEYIHTHAPNLVFLAIDINKTINQAAEDRVYAVLSTFPKLTQIALHYDLGLRDYEEIGIFPSEPQREGDLEFAGNVWRALTNGGGNSRLEEATFYIGEQDRDVGYGYPAEWVLHEWSVRRKLQVKRNERDDRRDEIYVTGTLDDSNYEGGSDGLKIQEVIDVAEPKHREYQDRKESGSEDNDMGF
ncbi:hypothetical protein V5O48_007855 [Marasmius crinis-equi]|uniref:Uncharacterized protein n=1 Tax=Marasmius crinis-equi TaxID=585013 RepID=A0ABR3FFK6_9AGAR